MSSSCVQDHAFGCSSNTLQGKREAVVHHGNDSPWLDAVCWVTATRYSTDVAQRTICPVVYANLCAWCPEREMQFEQVRRNPSSVR